MTAQSRLELIPSYREAVRREAAAQEALAHASDTRRFLAEELGKLTRAEAQSQIGCVLSWPSGRRAKIVGIGAHYLNHALAYPIVAYELTKRDTWAKRTSHLYGYIFDFELGHWTYGTVDAHGDFHAKRDTVKAEKIDA